MNAAKDKCRHFGTLMRAAQSGDSGAYRQLLLEILPLLRRWVARNRALQPQDVEDVVQDILLSVHAARFTYNPARPFLPWLAAITQHRVADGARRHVRLRRNEVAVAEYPETSDERLTNIDKASYRDPQALRQAIARLPASQRQAVEMLKLQEMTLKEAADASGTSVAGLKIAMHRALYRLRSVMVEEG